MTVKDLIVLLSAYDPQSPVLFADTTWYVKNDSGSFTFTKKIEWVQSHQEGYVVLGEEPKPQWKRSDSMKPLPSNEPK